MADTCHGISNDKYCSLACGVRSNIEIVDFWVVNSAMLFSLRADNIQEQEFNILLLYHKKSVSVSDLVYVISHFMSVYHNNVHLILGDFNINALNSNDNVSIRLSNLLLNYKLMINEPTHISGSLIDHVYSRREISELMNVTTIITNVFFSDHNAVKIKIARR